MKKMYILFEDGSVIYGKSFGAVSTVRGKIVYTTSMQEYIPIVTGKSNKGKIVLCTFPVIGSFGVNMQDCMDEVPGGCIVRNLAQKPSNFRAEMDFCTFCREKNIVGVYDVDTRAIMKKLKTDPDMICEIGMVKGGDSDGQKEGY